MIIEKIPEVGRLSPAQKLLLVTELWNDLAANPSEVPVSREMIAELDRRMESYRNDPTQVTSWEAIQQRILGKTPDSGRVGFPPRRRCRHSGRIRFLRTRSSGAGRGISAPP